MVNVKKVRIGTRGLSVWRVSLAGRSWSELEAAPHWRQCLIPAPTTISVNRCKQACAHSSTHQYEMQELGQLFTTRPDADKYQDWHPAVQGVSFNCDWMRASNARTASGFTLQHTSCEQHCKQNVQLNAPDLTDEAPVASSRDSKLQM